MRKARLPGINEARLLKIAVVAACLIPITAGGAGVLLGPAMVGIDTAPIAAESHYRYLSGLLLSIGVLFLTTVPRVERSTTRFRLLGIIVTVGGLCRLLGSLLNRNVDASSLFALGMELGVTPALLLWQARVRLGMGDQSVSSNRAPTCFPSPRRSRAAGTACRSLWNSAIRAASASR
jgi:uncharacterized membrane protein YfcA